MSGDATAAQVAHTVGYTSATQFSREHRAFCGLPLVQDITRLRANSTPTARHFDQADRGDQRTPRTPS